MIILALFNGLHFSLVFPKKSCTYTTYLMIIAYILRLS